MILLLCDDGVEKRYKSPPIRSSGARTWSVCGSWVAAAFAIARY